jgi:ribosomal protein S6
MTDASQGKKVYEIGYLIVPTVSPDHIAKEIDALKAVLNTGDVKVIAEESPKMRPLTYPMVKVVGQKRSNYDTGYFGWVKFESTSDVSKEVEKTFATSDKVLRSLLIKTVAENTMYGSRILKEFKDAEKPVGQAPSAISEKKADSSVEEIDKAVEKLITE